MYLYLLFCSCAASVIGDLPVHAANNNKEQRTNKLPGSVLEQKIGYPDGRVFCNIGLPMSLVLLV
jgi:hypothetical protein